MRILSYNMYDVYTSKNIFLKILIIIGEKLRKSLSDVSFEEIKEKSFELINVIEMLCEVCERPLGIREKFLKSIHFSSLEDYKNLLNRTRVHNRVEVDMENRRIYIYDHDFPGEVHPECIEKL